MFIKWEFPQVFIWVFLLFPSVVAAKEWPPEEFCQRAQQIVASTTLTAEVVIHTNYESFVESKASAAPLTVQQYLSNPQPGTQGLSRVLSCKMKTAERINAAREIEGDGMNVALGDGSCHAVNQYWLDSLREEIPPQEQRLSLAELIVDEEELAFMGPMWLRPWPFEPLYRDEGGQLHIRSKALYVPFAWWIPMPDRFKGTYYCHLISPVYLEALLRGAFPQPP